MGCAWHRSRLDDARAHTRGAGGGRRRARPGGRGDARDRSLLLVVGVDPVGGRGADAAARVVDPPRRRRLARDDARPASERAQLRRAARAGVGAGVAARRHRRGRAGRGGDRADRDARGEPAGRAGAGARRSRADPARARSRGCPTRGSGAGASRPCATSRRSTAASTASWRGAAATSARRCARPCGTPATTGSSSRRAHAATADDALALYDRIQEIEARSWKAADGVGITTGPMRDFYHRMVQRLARHDGQRTIIARKDDRDVAYCLGAVFAGEYRGLQFSYDDDHGQLLARLAAASTTRSSSCARRASPATTSAPTWTTSGGGPRSSSRRRCSWSFLGRPR